MTISFLRAFTATRMVKGKFRLAAPNGRSRQHYAFGQCLAEFCEGQKVAVARLKEGNPWVVTDNPLIGEVVLDGALEGVDFEVVESGQAFATG